MATANELFSELAAEGVADTIIVDNALRTMTIPDSMTTVGVESDDSVFRLKFKMPSTYGEFDLSDFDIRINFVNADGEGDIYSVTDKAVASNQITFTWLLGRRVFVKMGSVNFNICLRKYDTDGVTVVKEFNTTPATLTVLRGLETEQAAVGQYTDLVNQYLKLATDANNTATSALAQANSALESANTAKTQSDSAISRATNAATKAETATKAANDAANAATNATEDTKLATIAANAGATRADTAADNADTATTNANAATKAANTAASSAMSAANTAKTNADKASASVITSVTASTLEPGSNATVTASKTESGQALIIGIPRGARGDTGPAGTTEWSGIKNKPFSAIGDGLSVKENTLIGGPVTVTRKSTYAEVEAAWPNVVLLDTATYTISGVGDAEVQYILRPHAHFAAGMFGEKPVYVFIRAFNDFDKPTSKMLSRGVTINPDNIWGNVNFQGA